MKFVDDDDDDDIDKASDAAWDCHITRFPQTLRQPKLIFSSPVISVNGFLPLLTAEDLTLDQQQHGFTT